MTDTLYDALEICLQALEKGADIESCLMLFPALADDLRPILETATAARAQAIESVPADAMRRGRARVLQHAAELRENQRVASLPISRKLWQMGGFVRRLAAALAVIAFLFSGGTGLVFASSGSLPGDHLYPVKRSWEGVQLALIIDPRAKSEREMEFEHERVNEIHELFSESRTTQVDFQGKVEIQQVGVWQIAGLQILIEEDAVFDGQILPGALVHVIGETEDGRIKAERISLVQPAAATQTPTKTPVPQKTPTVRPTESKAPEKTVEAGETEKPEIEAPKPEKTDSHKESEVTKEKKSNDSGSEDGGGGGGGGDDGGEDK